MFHIDLWCRQASGVRKKLTAKMGWVWDGYSLPPQDLTSKNVYITTTAFSPAQTKSRTETRMMMTSHFIHFWWGVAVTEWHIHEVKISRKLLSLCIIIDEYSTYLIPKDLNGVALKQPIGKFYALHAEGNCSCKSAPLLITGKKPSF